MNERVETVLFSVIAVLFAAITLSSLTSLAFPAAPSAGDGSALHACRDNACTPTEQVSGTGNGMTRHG